MLSFKPIDADNILDIRPFFKYKASRTSDYTLGALYMWRDFYKTCYTIYNNMLLFKVSYLNRTSFTFPVGGGSLEDAISVLKDYCRANAHPLWFCTVPDEAAKLLIDRYHGTIPCPPSRDWADYLYRYEDLAQMAGRHFSGQRNHINKFKRLYPYYQYNAINGDNIGRVIDFLKYYQQNFSKDSSLAKEELARSLELLPYLEKFKLSGAFLEVDGTIIAMSVGEIINDTLYVHIEKANREYEGSYQMIVKEFASHCKSEEVKYINREEDVGDEGLRTSKLSYHPIYLLDKMCVLIP